MTARETWRRLGSVSALVTAAGVLVAAAAGGVTEPTGVATVVAVVASVLAYGIGPLVIAIAVRQSGLSSWWAVAAALLPAGLWTAVGLLFALSATLDTAPALLAVLVTTAPSSSALWLLVASVEVVRAGMHRWSLVFVSAFVTVLVVGSMLLEITGFDVRRVLVPLGWALWMIDLGRALRSRSSPVAERPAPVPAAGCTNCGAPRRTDGLAFCSSCGLPYRSERM